MIETAFFFVSLVVIVSRVVDSQGLPRQALSCSGRLFWRQGLQGVPVDDLGARWARQDSYRRGVILFYCIMLMSSCCAVFCLFDFVYLFV